MTKNIAVIGCSHSAGGYGPPEHNEFLCNWPRILSQKILDEGFDYKVYNISQYCSSVHLQLAQLSHLLQTARSSIDFIVFQVTDPIRSTFINPDVHYWEILEIHGIDSKNMINKSKNIIFNDNYYELNPGGMDLGGDKLKNNINDVINLNAGMAHSIKDRMKNDKILELFLNSLTYNFYYNQSIEIYYMSYIHYAKELLKKHNIPCIIYMHQGTHNKDENLIKSYDFVLSEMWDNFLEYKVDDGFHFGYDGNKRLVDELIWPRILEDLNV